MEGFMTDRKNEWDQKIGEYQAAISKTLDVFGKENYGQMVTQWNFTSLRQVLDGAIVELKGNLERIAQGYETELQKCSELKEPTGE